MLHSNDETPSSPPKTTPNQAPDSSPNAKCNAHALRPRVLYMPLYVWSCVTTGKFVATFLQELSPRFTESIVGMTLSAQYAITCLMGSYFGSMADAAERKSVYWGWGRIKVISVGVMLGTLSFLGHDLAKYINFDYLQKIMKFPWDLKLIWHISMRLLMAISLAVVAPATDGLTLAQLDCIEGSSQSEFGLERMYGAVFWGIGSLAAGIGIDIYGFRFLYILLIITTFASYVVMAIYLVSIQRDTTGVYLKGVKTTKTETKSGMSTKSNYESVEPISNNEQGVLLQTKTKQQNGELPAKDLFLLICQTGYGKTIIFFVFALSIGISVIDNLAFIYFDFLGSSNTMNGATVVFTVLFELPLFYLAPYLLKRLGPGRLLLFAGVAYVIRVFGYTIVPEGHMGIVLMLETLHGISYANLKTGSVEFVSWVVPKGSEATGQGILIFVNYFGVVVGLALGGWIQELYGPRIMWACMGFIASLGIIVLLLAEKCCPMESKSIAAKRTKKQDESESLLGNGEVA